MKVELNIPEEMIDAIADKVMEKLLPIIQSLQEPDRYLDVSELSTLIGKSQGQIYQWVNRASHGLTDFPYQKAGRSLRFSMKDIMAWMKNHSSR